MPSVKQWQWRCPAPCCGMLCLHDLASAGACKSSAGTLWLGPQSLLFKPRHGDHGNNLVPGGGLCCVQCSPEPTWVSRQTHPRHAVKHARHSCRGYDGQRERVPAPVASSAMQATPSVGTAASTDSPRLFPISRFRSIAVYSSDKNSGQPRRSRVWIRCRRRGSCDRRRGAPGPVWSPDETGVARDSPWCDRWSRV